MKVDPLPRVRFLLCHRGAHFTYLLKLNVIKTVKIISKCYRGLHLAFFVQTQNVKKCQNYDFPLNTVLMYKVGRVTSIQKGWVPLEICIFFVFTLPNVQCTLFFGGGGALKTVVINLMTVAH